MKQKKKNKEIITVGLVLLLVIVIVGVSYAAFTFSKTGVTENAITTSAVTMIYTEGDNQISINNAVPITEEVGKTLSDENYVFDFTINIKTGPKMPISYEVTAIKDASSTMGNEDVRLYLQKSLDGTNYNDEVLEPSPYTPLDADDEFGAKAGEMVMDVGTVSEKVTYYYRLRMWVDSSYELSSEAKSFTVKVNAYGKEGVELGDDSTKICRRATILHTEECSQNYASGCCSSTVTSVNGSDIIKGSIISYGNLGSKGVFRTGDAFDCDVNADGIYDSATERFYYVTDLESDDNVAVMIYYSNITEGLPNNANTYAYDDENEFVFSCGNNCKIRGPVTLLKQLPTIAQWENVKLSNEIRDIRHYDNSVLMKDFNYGGYAARFLTVNEVETACKEYFGLASSITSNGALDVSQCRFLLENTVYSNKDLKNGYWLENSGFASNSYGERWVESSVLRGYSRARGSHGAYNDLNYGVRPVIEVSKNDISY